MTRLLPPPCGQSARPSEWLNSIETGRRPKPLDFRKLPRDGTDHRGSEQQEQRARGRNLPKVKPVLSDEHFSVDGTQVGADKAYDTQAHVAALRKIGVTPHVGQNNCAACRSWSARNTHAAPCIFGWDKQHALCTGPSIVGSPGSVRASSSCERGWIAGSSRDKARQ
jgi:hypothetical protein